MTNEPIYDAVSFKNISFPMNLAYHYSLKEKGLLNLICPNRVDFIFYELNQLTDDIIIIDFSEIEEITNSFVIKYLKYKLQSKLKIFEVGQSIYVLKVFDNVINDNL